MSGISVSNSWKLAIAVAISGSMAFAANPKNNPIQKLSPEARALMVKKLSEDLNTVRRMSSQDFNDLFSIKDAKGNRRSLLTQDQSGWALSDPTENGTEGTSTEKAYREFDLDSPASPAPYTVMDGVKPFDEIKLDLPRGKMGEKVLVAIIDSGVDINHSDFQYTDQNGKKQSLIWTNPKEIPGNGLDDDHNGYVDDIHGWNFLGNGTGKVVSKSNLEVTRLLGALKKKVANGNTLSDAEKLEMATLEKGYADKQAELLVGVERIRKLRDSFQFALENLRLVGLTEPTLEAVKAMEFQPDDIINTISKAIALEFLNQKLTVETLSNAYRIRSKSALQKRKSWFDFDLNISDIIGDNPEKMDDIGYGNGNVMPDEADEAHGTHVAGIVGAVRNNNSGINGQAGNVEFMILRTVPDGDERDKDVANSIRYAVDNGAKIMNGSFGKGYSPNSVYVREAIRYAESHGVLIVHAAGNDNSDNGLVGNFPNRQVMAAEGNRAEPTNWIEVGASASTKGPELAAEFSNFGKTTVDIFAPGAAITSTVPGSQVATFNGTSMASPEVAGVAALVLSHNPNYTAAEVRELLMKTSRKYEGLTVLQPHGDVWFKDIPRVDFSSLSISGGILDAYEALKVALSK